VLVGERNTLARHIVGERQIPAVISCPEPVNIADRLHGIGGRCTGVAVRGQPRRRRQAVPAYGRCRTERTDRTTAPNHRRRFGRSRSERHVLARATSSMPSSTDANQPRLPLFPAVELSERTRTGSSDQQAWSTWPSCAAMLRWRGRCGGGYGAPLHERARPSPDDRKSRPRARGRRGSARPIRPRRPGATGLIVWACPCS
jgi:hypothetical protein